MEFIQNIHTHRIHTNWATATCTFTCTLNVCSKRFLCIIVSCDRGKGQLSHTRHNVLLQTCSTEIELRSRRTLSCRPNSNRKYHYYVDWINPLNEWCSLFIGWRQTIVCDITRLTQSSFPFLSMRQMVASLLRPSGSRMDLPQDRNHSGRE